MQMESPSTFNARLVYLDTFDGCCPEKGGSQLHTWEDNELFAPQFRGALIRPEAGGTARTRRSVNPRLRPREGRARSMHWRVAHADPSGERAPHGAQRTASVPGAQLMWHHAAGVKARTASSTWSQVTVLFRVTPTRPGLVDDVLRVERGQFPAPAPERRALLRPVPAARLGAGVRISAGWWRPKGYLLCRTRGRRRRGILRPAKNWRREGAGEGSWPASVIQSRRPARRPTRRACLATFLGRAPCDILIGGARK